MRRKHVVHIINGAYALCGNPPGPPGQWPRGHKWVPIPDAAKATCQVCIEEAKKRRKLHDARI